MRGPFSLTLGLFLLSMLCLPCQKARAADPAESGGTMTEDKRLSSFVNVTVNATVIIGALMTEAMTGAMTEVAAGMSEGVATALDNADSGKKKGAEIRQEASRNAPAMVREMIGTMLPETRQQLGAAIDNITPAQRKDLLADIKDPSFDRAFDTIRKKDFGLPRLTETLSVDDVLGYMELAKKEDPRLGQIMEAIRGMKEPRLFAEMKRAVEKEKTEAETKADPVPATITKLPATYRFAPGAETTISLRGNKEVRLSWEAQLAMGASCENYGIRVQQGGNTASTPYGGLTLYPENGKVIATMKNMEAFPITVTISTEK